MTSRGLEIPSVAALIKEDGALAAWLQKKHAVAKIARLPERSDIMETITEQLVVEYYTR